MIVEISEEVSKYMLNFIKDVIEKFGPRMPCSSAEAQSAEFIKNELAKTCDEVEIETFKCHPRAFLGWIKIDVLLVFFSISSFLIMPIIASSFIVQILIMSIAVGLNITAFLIIWNEFFNYREFIDKLFKEKSSQNVIGKIKAKGELKKLIIFSGHHDSALQFNLLRYLKVGYVIIVFLGLGVIFFWTIISIITIILVIFSLDFLIVYNIMLILFIIAIPVFISLLFFVSNGDKANKVPGAIDNLSADAVVLGLGRYLKTHKNIITNNTEIRLISFGCEEAGLRGAYRYVATHLEELKNYNAKVVNMDIIQNEKNIYVLEYEPTTRTKHSPQVVKNIKNAAALVEIDIKTIGSGFLKKLMGQIMGGTDATPFSKANIKAATIQSMEFSKFFSFYHQPTDNTDMISKAALINVLKICIAYLMKNSDD